MSKCTIIASSLRDGQAEVQCWRNDYVSNTVARAITVLVAVQER